MPRRAHARPAMETSGGGTLPPPEWAVRLLARPESGASVSPPEPPGPGQPTGTVTLVFTDIEGSTRLLQVLGDRYPAMLADHHRLIREAFAGHGALERGSAGDGLYFVFQGARAAVQ